MLNNTLSHKSTAPNSMDALPRDYGAHSFDTKPPSIELQQMAFAALKNHPHCIKAKSHIYCEPLVMLEPVSFIDRVRWDEEIIKQIKQKLLDSDSVLIVSYTTSNTIPEPLSGGGKSFDFVMHPLTLDVLHFSTGNWRS